MKSVKLNGPDLTPATRIQRSGSGLPRAGGVGASPQPDASDGVMVSSRAEEVARLVVQAGQLGEIRQDRVEPLRQRIQAGVYHVPATEIAEAILLDENRTLHG